MTNLAGVKILSVFLVGVPTSVLGVSGLFREWGANQGIAILSLRSRDRDPRFLISSLGVETDTET